MFVVAHSAHWLLEAGPLLVVPIVLLVYWLRDRARRRGDVDSPAARRPPPPDPRRAVADERLPHA